MELTQYHLGVGLGLASLIIVCTVIGVFIGRKTKREVKIYGEEQIHYPGQPNVGGTSTVPPIRAAGVQSQGEYEGRRELQPESNPIISTDRETDGDIDQGTGETTQSDRSAIAQFEPID